MLRRRPQGWFLERIPIVIAVDALLRNLRICPGTLQILNPDEVQHIREVKAELAALQLEETDNEADDDGVREILSRRRSRSTSWKVASCTKTAHFFVTYCS